VVLLVIVAGRDAPTALRTSVIDELPEPCPDFRRWWCIGMGSPDWLRCGSAGVLLVGCCRAALAEPSKRGEDLKRGRNRHKVGELINGSGPEEEKRLSERGEGVQLGGLIFKTLNGD
jgi:hypothetical protein